MTETPNENKPLHKKTPGPAGFAVRGGSPQARRTSAVILEVLAGGRTPADAAAAMGISVTRYYQLEARAIEGLVRGCEPPRTGPHLTPERELLTLKRDNARLERECARSRALLRMSQRTLGVVAAKTTPVKAKPGDKVKRCQKPTARALKAAAGLMQSLPSTEMAANDNKATAGAAPGASLTKAPPAIARPSLGV